MESKNTVQEKFLIEILPYLQCNGGSDVKNLPTVHKTQVSSVDQEDPLEKEMATCSSILAWRTPWTEEPGRLQSMGWQKRWTGLSD